MVRLEVHISCLFLEFSNPFQFHYGAIGSSLKRAWHLAVNLFQFHYGAIGRKSCNTPGLKIENFNSIMVRLEVLSDDKISSFNFISIPLWCDWKLCAFPNYKEIPKFQFHYGAIGSLFRPLSFFRQSPFQFHYGAIGSKKISYRGKNKRIISIPLWCDWKLRKLKTSNNKPNFNSIMVRLEAGLLKNRLRFL